jgi:hypothetical protein
MIHSKLFAVVFFSLALSPAFAAESNSLPAAGYAEIPYYLKQLETTTLEDKKLEFVKIIHDAVVSADFSDKKVLKQMDPIIQKIQIAADSGLDRAYLEGQSTYLMSAIEFYEREGGFFSTER